MYIVQLQGFEVKGQQGKVYGLRKALCGLKQAPRAWNQRIDEFMNSIGFDKCVSEHGLYVQSANTMSDQKS